MPPLTIAYIVRHGETEENLKMIMQGQLDTQLNETGKEQAKLVADALREVAFDKAYSSDLSRARETAKAILSHHPSVQLVEDKALRERHLGDLQGKPVGTRYAPNDPLLESHEKLGQRALAWWDRHIVAPAKSQGWDGQPIAVLLVSHGGFIGTLIKTLSNNGRASMAPGITTDKRALNASITTVEVGRAADGKIRGVVTRYADTAHLDRAEGVEVLQSNADELVRD
ncbi:phosphoglycerate mutase-like protein [Schizophyllum commune H4-8]|uniref:phosphoglycerate mutase-like protein n=1 Tax=Schizophyllum commune (strain H4-8 / FGSC 9210) TaxID=578458 RepID=UPI00215F0816|nr:phosphoglycerate mutase-like protein [Schizophyllum commune H4-8]KAI5900462.1 phosphoglycerate mutase-like protein [Schizophyllum commune H4-8]